MAQSASLHYPDAFANSAAFPPSGKIRIVLILIIVPSFPSSSPGVRAVGPGSAVAGTDGRAAAAAAAPGTPVAGPGYPLPAASANPSNAYFYAGPTPPAQAPSLAPPPVASLPNQLPPSPQQAFPGPHAAPYHGGDAALGSMGPAMMPTDFRHLQSPSVPGSAHSVSPQRAPSPNAGFQQACSSNNSRNTLRLPSTQWPPLPSRTPPANAGHLGSATSTTSNAASAPSPSSPQSPGSQNLEHQRVKLLLEINVELLQEVNRLQSSGHGWRVESPTISATAQRGQAGFDGIG
ncbi:hypothetical protein MRB53_041316 [Persea americana]|nr:hypothetical protein MRB53_041316 [Persea americana]